MRGLIVPGAGPMAEVFSTMGELCDEMNEARRVCRSLHTQLNVVYNELTNRRMADHLPSKAFLDKYVGTTSRFLQFLHRYHRKELVYRIVEHSTMMSELRLIYEEVFELFEFFQSTTTIVWSGVWDEDHQLQKEVLDATVKDNALILRELQHPRARTEALLMLKFELEQRGERHNDDVMGIMISMLTTIIMASRTVDEYIPDWFLPLYEVEFEAKPFSCGLFGSVHRGLWWDGTGVVIKFFSVDDEQIDDHIQRKMEQELNSLFPLNHPNIIRMLAASHVNSPPFIVYEYASNGSLSSFLSTGDGHKAKMWRMLHEAALGLNFIHKQNIVHGDLNPNNILVDEGHTKLSGFGLNTMRTYSNLSHKCHADPDSTGLRWRAPECLKRRPTAASDVYSFAMCMIEAATGEPPFALLSDDDIRANMRKGEIPEKPNTMTAEMWELVVSMTIFDPAKRAKLDHVLAKLESFAELESAAELAGVETIHSSVVVPGSCQPSVDLPSTEDTLRTSSIPVLVKALHSASTEKLEELLQHLVEGCTEDEQRGQLYDVNGVPVLVELVKFGRSHFIQLSALLCLSWVVQLDSYLTKQEFEMLRVGVHEISSQELSALNCVLQGGNDQEKIKAAIYCSGIGVATKGGDITDFLPLVALLRNESDTIKLWATIAIGKLANNEMDRMNFANEGAIQLLFEHIQFGTEAQKLWTIYALAKLCQDNEPNSLAITERGAIPLLVAFLRGGSNRQKEFVAFFFGHLAFASDNICAMISRAGAITSLISLLRSGNMKQKESVGFALGGLMSRSVDNCTAIEVEGGVELLVSLLITGNNDQKEAAAFSLGAFVVWGDVKSYLTELEEAITYLAELLTSGSDTQKQLAALTLGTFSVGNNMKILGAAMERAVLPLLSLIRSGMNGPLEQAAFALSHFAGMSDEMRAALAREGSIPTLILLLQTGTESMKEHAALALRNLSMNNVAVANEITSDGAIPLFISLIRGGTEKQKVCATLIIGNLAMSSNANNVTIANEGGIPLLVTLLRTGTEGMKEGAAFALARLATNDVSCMRMVHDGAIPHMIRLLQTRNDRQTEHAVFALSEFADKNYQNCESIAAGGGIPPLVALLGSGTDKEKEYAAMTLSFICGEDELDNHRVAISRAGAISPLVSLVKSGTDPQKRWAALALGSLAVKDDANCTVIAREGAISPLISLLSSPLDRQKENAAFALGRLAAYSDDKTMVATLEGGIPAFVDLLRVGTDAQKEEAAFALGHISLINEPISVIIANNGAISLLVSLLRSGTDNQKAYATMALVNLAAHNRSIHSDVIHEGIIGLLVQLERTGSETQRKWAAYSLGRLAFKVHGH